MFARAVLFLCILLQATAAGAQEDTKEVDELLVSFTELCTALTRAPETAAAPDLSSFGLTFGTDETNQSLYTARVTDYFATYLDSLGTDTLTPSQHAVAVAQNALTNVTTNHRPRYPYFARTWLFASSRAVFTHSLYEDEFPARAQCEIYATGELSQDATERLMLFVFGESKTCKGPRRFRRTTTYECNWPRYERNFWVEVIRNEGHQLDPNFIVPPNIRLTMMYQAPT